MKRTFVAVLAFTAASATLAQTGGAAGASPAGRDALQQPSVVQRVADDAKVIDRVAEVSKRDLPVDLLRRLVGEDIDLLRGKRNDGSYQYAGYERLEAARVSDSFSIQPANDESRLSSVDIKGRFVFRLILDSPSRRMLVTKNRRIWIDHVDVEYMPQGGSSTKVQNVKVETWLEPGQTKQIDFEDIARQATVRVFARADKEAGYGNLELSLVEARVFDFPDSPYADAVSSAKAIQRALDRSDIPSIRSMASRIASSLGGAGTPAGRSIDVTAAVSVRPTPAELSTPAALPPSVATSPDVAAELQSIEDLLTGSEAEKRQGMDRLHQLLRRLRR